MDGVRAMRREAATDRPGPVDAAASTSRRDRHAHRCTREEERRRCTLFGTRRRPARGEGQGVRRERRVLVGHADLRGSNGVHAVMSCVDADAGADPAKPADGDAGRCGRTASRGGARCGGDCPWSDLVARSALVDRSCMYAGGTWSRSGGEAAYPALARATVRQPERGVGLEARRASRDAPGRTWSTRPERALPNCGSPRRHAVLRIATPERSCSTGRRRGMNGRAAPCIPLSGRPGMPSRRGQGEDDDKTEVAPASEQTAAGGEAHRVHVAATIGRRSARPFRDQGVATCSVAPTTDRIDRKRRATDGSTPAHARGRPRVDAAQRRGRAVAASCGRVEAAAISCPECFAACARCSQLESEAAWGSKIGAPEGLRPAGPAAGSRRSRSRSEARRLRATGLTAAAFDAAPSRTPRPNRSEACPAIRPTLPEPQELWATRRRPTCRPALLKARAIGRPSSRCSLPRSVQRIPGDDEPRRSTEGIGAGAPAAERSHGWSAREDPGVGRRSAAPARGGGGGVEHYEARCERARDPSIERTDLAGSPAAWAPRRRATRLGGGEGGGGALATSAGIGATFPPQGRGDRTRRASRGGGSGLSERLASMNGRDTD